MIPERIGSRIAGVEHTAGAVLDNVNPSLLDDVVCQVAQADTELARSAVDAASRAFASWSITTPWQRFEVLDRTGSSIIARADELGDLLAREEGKTLAEARGEVIRAGQIFKYFAGQALQPSGYLVDSVRPGIEVQVAHEPVGVVAVITPWNFPIAIPAWKIAPALAYGNTVVFKPAELVPASAWALVDILHESGLPEGVLNLVLGKGSQVGGPILEHPEVAAVTFTGSVATGATIRSLAAAHGAKIQLELGGKNPLVVLDDADMSVAVESAVQGGWGSTGQRCTASSFLVVQRGIHDRFVEMLQTRGEELKVGDARDPETHMGPVVDGSQMSVNQGYLQVAANQGGDVRGGDLVESVPRGHFMRPALVLGTNVGDRINQEEVFGPVMSIIKVDTYEQALAAANSSTMNLSAGIVTQDLAAASDFRRRSKAGIVMVNLPTAGVDFHVPFGGRGSSSEGPREQGPAAREFFTTSKTSYVMPGAPT